jgi:uncharacterized repeat protein (TIGR01451 family)
MPRHLALLCLCAALSAPALAAAQVDIALEAKKRVEELDARGATVVKLIEPGTATPGDEIVYSVRLTNKGTSPAEKLRFVTPVPAELAYRAGSASGGDAEIAFSADGGRSFDRPERLFVTDARGGRRAAAPADYTHIQWRLPSALAPMAVRTVTFHATVR